MKQYILKNNKKQLLLSCLAFLLIVLGYFNYNYTISGEVSKEISSRDNEATFGDVELVSTTPVEDKEEEEYISDIVPNDESYEVKNVSRADDNYFQETKLERDRMYSEMIETYQEIISNEMTPEDQKSIAVQEINNITKLKNEIMISENLILNKGFSNVVILVNNGNVNVVVKSPNLVQEDIAKIQNIIEREFQVELKNINISNK